MERIVLAVLTVGAIGFAFIGRREVAATTPDSGRSETPRTLIFEEHEGEDDRRPSFLARGRGFRLSLEGSAATLALTGAPEHPVRLRFVGGNDEPRAAGVDELPGKVYHSPARSKGRPTGHATFARVRYENVYDGIDVLYYGNDERLEFDLELAPGSDPSRISLALNGATGLALSPNGDVTFRAGGASATLHRPLVYQERDGVRSEVRSEYVFIAETQVGLALGGYDESRPLVVDPIFSFDTAGDDVVRGVEVNAAGEVYLLAETTDSSGFPWDQVEPGSKTTQCYLAKMDPTSSTVLYTILFAGTDACSTLALAPTGVVYFPGYELPVMPGLHATTLVSVDDRFGAPDVNRVQVDNYDPFRRQVGAIAADANDKIYLLGTCRVVLPGKPPLELFGFNDAPDAGSGQPTCESGASTEHVLLTKVARDGTVEYGTFLASDDIQDVSGTGLAVDDEERVYVVRPRSASVPVTPDAFRDACPDPECGYLLAIDTTETGPDSLEYATYLWQMAGSDRQVLRLGAPDSVFLASDGRIDLGFPITSFNPYPDVPRPVDPDTGIPVSQGIHVARFDIGDDGAPNRLRYARVAVGGVLPDGSEHLADLRVLPSRAVVVSVLLAPDPNEIGQPFQSDLRTYYRSGVNAFLGNDTSLQMYPNALGETPIYAMAFTPSGQPVFAHPFSPTSAPGPWQIRVDASSADLDPGPYTPPTINVWPLQTTFEAYDPTGAVVPGYLAAFDWDEEADSVFGIAADCTHTYNVTHFPLGTTHAVCTAIDDDGATATQAYDVTVIPAINTTAANVPIDLVDISGPASSVHTPGAATATFLGTVEVEGLTWLRTRVNQKPIAPPAGLQLGSSPFYYDVGTTADTTGPIHLCIDFTGMSFTAPAEIRLHRLAGSLWSDVTDSVDLPARQICTVAADANELGTFAVFTPADERTRVEILAGVGRSPGNHDGVGFVPTGDGGPATSAALSFPTAVAFDLPGNAMYIADGRQVRRVDLVTGIITRYAGLDPTLPSGNVFGNPVEGGLATETEFMQIDDVAVDREGNLFLAEAQSCVIQRIDRSTRLVRNVAGAWLGGQLESCGNGGDGGPARSATISLSSRMAFDARGNLFFVQSSGLPQQVTIGTPGFIRRIAAGADGLILGRPEETISTIAGSSQDVPVEGAPLASGMAPHALAFGRSGDLYIASYDKILRILPAQSDRPITGDPAESLRIVAGGSFFPYRPFGGDQGHPLDADLILMSDLEVLPAGELLVSHWNTKRVRLVIPGPDGAVDAGADERITTLAGFEHQLPPGPADLSDFAAEGYALSTLFFPGSAMLDPRGGILVADPLRHYVRRFGYRARGFLVSPLTVDFGTQTLGTTSAARTITVTNDSPDPVSVTAVTIFGEFTAPDPSCPPLAPAASCIIEVSFAPTTLGPLAGELQITDSTLTVHRVALRGVGKGIPAVILAPSSLSFASQVAGTTSPPQTVTLTNTGNGELSIAAIAVVSPDFAHTTTCPALLGPGAGCAIDVVFRPIGEVGHRSGELRVASDAAGSPHAASLTGFGDTRLLSVSPPVLDFGLVDVGSSSAGSTVTLTNTGSLPLTWNGFQVEGATSAGIIDTFAGTGVLPNNFGISWRDGFPARTEPIGRPYAIVVDGRGNVYFTTEYDVQNPSVLRVDAATRTIATVWKQGGSHNVVDGGGDLGAPVSLAVDRAGNVYVAEIPYLAFGGGRVRRIDAATFAITLVAGNGIVGSTGDGGPALAASFMPSAIAVDGSGNLFLADNIPFTSTTGPRIRRVDAQTGLITRVAGGAAPGLPPHGDGGPATSAALFDPRAVAVDAAGNLFVLEGLGPTTGRIRRVDAATGIIQTFGDRSVSFGSSQRGALAVDASGHLVASDARRVARFDAQTGVSSTIAGDFLAVSVGDGGPGTAARLERVEGVAVDASGHLYVSDWEARRVRRVEGLTSSGASLYPATSECASVLAIGDSCTLSVRFQADLPGPQRALLEIDTDATGSPHPVALTGVGARPLAFVSPARLTFADRAVATLSMGMTVILANGGNAVLGLSSLAVEGQDAADFALSHTCGASLAPGRTCLATVRFAPGSTGPRAAELRVGHDAPGAPAVVSLSGLGTALSLTLSPALLDFGAVPVNAPATLSVNVTHTGTGLVSLTDRVVDGAHAEDFEASGCAGDLSAGASCTLLVTFRPRDAGARSARLLVARTGSSWSHWVDLQGVGPAPSAISVSHTTLDFGSVAVGASDHRTATIENVGTAPVTITALAVAGRTTVLGSLRTLAGDGGAGAGPDGVPALEAHLGEIYDVAVDAAGNQYLADATLHRVWRVDALTGRVGTFAGTGVRGYLGDGGPAAAALLDTPTSVAIDAAGRLYIADTGNHVVRRVGPGDTIETFAGSGSQGYAGDGGPATSASLGSPQGLAIDRSGTLYVAEALNHVIRRVASDGTISSLVGDGVAGAGLGGSSGPLRLRSPVDVAVSPAGELAIADLGNARVVRVDRPEGADRSASGVASLSVGGVAWDFAGRILASETQSHRIWRTVADGPGLSAFAGSGQSGWQDAALAVNGRLSFPRGLAVDLAGHVLVADTGNRRLRQVDGISSNTGTEFSRTTDCLRTLLPQESCELDVTFSPGFPGLHRALLNLTHDAVAGPRSIELTGLGARSIGYVTPTAVSFTGVEVGSTAVRSLHIVNAGNAPLHSLSLSVLTFHSFSGASNCPSTLDPGLGCEFPITFAPTTVGLQQGSVRVSHDGVQEFFELRGTSVPTRTEITLTSVTNASIFGEPVTFSIAVTSPFGTPGGSVVLTDGGATVPFLPNVVLNGGAGALIADALPAGAHALRAHYQGDPLRAPSVSVPLDHTVAKQPTTVHLVPDSTSLIHGESLDLAAGVTSPTGGLITGTIRFLDDASPLDPPVPIAFGSASLSVLPSAGSHAYSAQYAGDASSEPSTSSPVAVAVAKATTATTLSASSNPAYPNFPVTFTATVAPQFGGVPSGRVTFRSGPFTVLGSVPLMGNQASLTTTFANLSVASVNASYEGDGNFLPSTSDRIFLPVQRVPTTVTLTSSPNPSFAGQAVTFTVTVSSPVGPPPDGQQVRLLGLGGSSIPILNLIGGSASYVASNLSAGNRFVAALYAGNLTFAGASASVVQVVNRYSTTLSLTSSANPSSFGAPVTFTAVVSSPGGPPPDGQIVTFFIPSVGAVSRSLVGGVATVTTAALRAGAHQVRAAYGGDAAFLAATSPVLMQTVSPAATTTALTSSLNPSSLGARVTFTAVVNSASGPATGTVAFRRGTVVIGIAALSGGRATMQTTSLPRGSWTITATYNPAPPNFGGSVGTLVQVVN